MVRKPKRRIPASSIPLMSMQVAIYSWETIARRTMMMANGTCSQRREEALHRRIVPDVAGTADRTDDAVIAINL
jgi:hypothetical protein